MRSRPRKIRSSGNANRKFLGGTVGLAATGGRCIYPLQEYLGCCRYVRCKGEGAKSAVPMPASWMTGLDLRGYTHTRGRAVSPSPIKRTLRRRASEGYVHTCASVWRWNCFVTATAKLPAPKKKVQYIGSLVSLFEAHYASERSFTA